MLRKLVALPMNMAMFWGWSLVFLMVVVAPVMGLVSLATGEIKPCDDNAGPYGELFCGALTSIKMMLPIVGGILVVAAVGLGLLVILNRGAVESSEDEGGKLP